MDIQFIHSQSAFVGDVWLLTKVESGLVYVVVGRSDMAGEEPKMAGWSL
jgi:hypothetical protein